MTNWPDHTPEPGEGPRWLDWAAPVAIVIGVALLLSGVGSGAGGANTWRMPELSIPQIELPAITLPDLPRAEQPEPPVTVEFDESAAAIAEALVPDFDSGNPVTQSVPFDDCMDTISRPESFFGPAIVVEDTADRRVARFKVQDGTITVTCSRTDGTMRIEQGD